MLKKIKAVAVCCAVTMLAAAMPISANAANDLKINDAASVAVGDTFTYSMYISDASKGVMGMQAYVFYDTEYLQIDAKSINFDTLEGVIYNGNLDGYMTFNFSDISNYADFSSRAQLTSMDFKVLKEGNTNITYFIREMYDSDMVSLTGYTLTYDITADNEIVVSEQTPIVEASEKYINTYQGNFINYIDGKGNDNTDEKSDHKSVVGQKTTMVPQNNQSNQKYTDVQQSKGSSVTTNVIIVALVLIACAIGGVMYFRYKDKLKNGINANDTIYDDDMTDNDL